MKLTVSGRSIRENRDQDGQYREQRQVRTNDKDVYESGFQTTVEKPIAE